MLIAYHKIPVVLALLIFSCTAQTGSIPDRAEEIERKFELLEKDRSDQEAQQAFFNVFPANFRELQDIYGYENEKPAPLYRFYYEHLSNGFDKLYTINDTVFYQRLIDLSVNGRWDGDAVDFVQNMLRERLRKDRELFCFLVKRLGNKEQYSFWVFFLDGPHPAKEIPEYLLNTSETDKEMFRKIKKAHEFVLNDWKEH